MPRGREWPAMADTELPRPLEFDADDDAIVIRPNWGTPAVGLILGLVSAIVLIAGTDAQIRNFCPYGWPMAKYALWALVIAGIQMLGSRGRLVRIFRDGRVVLSGKVFWLPWRVEYKSGDMLGLAASTKVRHDRLEDYGPVETHRIVLVHISTAETELVRCRSRAHLGDCRRAIEAFTGIPLAVR